MTEIMISASKEYSVLIERGLLDRAGELMGGLPERAAGPSLFRMTMCSPSMGSALKSLLRRPTFR